MIRVQLDSRPEVRRGGREGRSEGGREDVFFSFLLLPRREGGREGGKEECLRSVFISPKLTLHSRHYPFLPPSLSTLSTPSASTS